jgi:hypothetical protein
VRVVNEAQAAVVRRIFEMTRDGMGLAKIRRKLNDERIPGPRGAWAITGVREVLHRRDYIGQIITNRIQRAWDDEAERAIRVEQPESERKIRRDETLRIVSDDLWQAAHARVEKTKSSYLRRGNQLVGQVESTKGLYLLSGFLSCGVCRKPMIATRRGRSMTLVYVCREHRERGDVACTNATGVSAADLDVAVVTSLLETFTEQTFIEHLEKQASNVEARQQREAERAGILAELPTMAAAEQRLVKRIATVEDDALVAALKTEWQEAKAKREAAEHRLSELESIERDMRADRAEIEVLLETWKGWGNVLAQVEDAPGGSIPAEAQAVARQILKKVLAGPIEVTPSAEVPGSWTFQGYSRFDDGVLRGAVASGEAVVVRYSRRIAGGSDPGDSTVRSTDMAPIPPTLVTPRLRRGAPRFRVPETPRSGARSRGSGGRCGRRSARVGPGGASGCPGTGSC